MNYGFNNKSNYNIICGKYCGDIIDIKIPNAKKKIKLNDELFVKFSVSDEDKNKLLKEEKESYEELNDNINISCEYKLCPKCRTDDVEDVQLMMRENNSQCYDRDIIPVYQSLMENKKRYNLLRKNEKFGELSCKSWNSIAYNQTYLNELASISDDKLTDFSRIFFGMCIIRPHDDDLDNSWYDDWNEIDRKIDCDEIFRFYPNVDSGQIDEIIRCISINRISQFMGCGCNYYYYKYGCVAETIYESTKILRSRSMTHFFWNMVNNHIGY